MSKAEVPGEAYWSDITRYSRLIEARLAYATGRILLGVGRRTHKASWEGINAGETADWFRREVACLGLPVDEAASTLVIAHDADRSNVTSYIYKTTAANLTVIHKGVNHDGIPDDVLRLDQAVPGQATFISTGITEADYAKLHEELAHGASIPALGRR